MKIERGKVLPSDCFSLTLYLCVVGRFACQVPLLSSTRTAIPERFFWAENYRREFSVPKTGGLNVEVFALRVNFSEGTCQVKRGL